jgi:hypothetical protein
MQTTQTERAFAIQLLHAAQLSAIETNSNRPNNRVIEPIGPSFLLAPEEAAALMDFAEDN